MTASEAMQHSVTNTALCQWLNITPDMYPGPHGKSHDVQLVYPDLSTPGEFWTLWSALVSTGKAQAIGLIRNPTGTVGARLAATHTLPKVFSGEDVKPWVSLFKAAVAMMLWELEETIY